MRRSQPHPTLVSPADPCTPVSRRRWLLHNSLLALGGWFTASPGAVAVPAACPGGPLPIELARDLSPDELAALDVTRYLVSEKLDGVRALWTGSCWLTRSGRAIPAPSRWLAALPAGRPLDGELWLGRGRFEAVSGLLHRADSAEDPLWDQLRYAVFDLPAAEGPYAERLNRLRAMRGTWATTPAAGVLIEVIEQRHVSDAAALREWFDTVIALGGEGLMLHAAEAPFQPGRSGGHLLKLKPLADAEAVVIAHLPGKGRHAGRLGALQVRDASGRQFAIGSGLSDALRDAPPAIGRRITFRYRGLTRTGLPRFATFWRLHVDE